MCGTGPVISSRLSLPWKVGGHNGTADTEGLGGTGKTAGGRRFPPLAEKIILVMSNLNTHSVASLYETFPVEEAKRLRDKLEIYRGYRR
jgi:hypothetical protein